MKTLNAAATATVEGTRGAKALIADANKALPADVLRQLGIAVGKGGRFACPSCKGHETSATFRDDAGDYTRRWRCTNCDDGGSVVDMVATHKGLSDDGAARWVLGMPSVNDVACEIKTSQGLANTLEKEMAAFVGSETRPEKVAMRDSSPKRADGLGASVAEGECHKAFVEHVSPYLLTVMADGKPREFRFVKRGRGVVKCWVWTPEKTPDDVGEVLSDAHRRGWNAYVTVNPIRADIVDDVVRRWKTPEPDKKRQTTNDTDIERRTFIPVDVDPIRPSGTLATPEQQEAAKTVADQVIEWYRAEFPNHAKPLYACSGSGYQILLPCDLPADEEADSIVANLLKMFGKSFDTEAVHIDQTVKNRSRIMRVCGTMAFYSDGKRFGSVISHPPERSDVLTMDDLRLIVPKPEPKPSPVVMSADLPRTRKASLKPDNRRLDAYIEPILGDIRAAADGTKHDVLYAKTAHIANHVAGAGQQGREAEIKGRIREALAANAGHVDDWTAADKTIDDAWAKGVTDPIALPDREPPKSVRGRKAEDEEAAAVDLGEPKPEYDGRRYYDPHIIGTRFLDANGSGIVVIKGTPYKYDDGIYRQVADSDLTAELTRFTSSFFERHHCAEIALFKKEGHDDPPIRQVTASVIKNARLAVDGVCTDSRAATFPGWLRRRPGDWPANRVIHCGNGLLNADTLEFAEGHNPRWLSLCKSEADWQGIDAACPRFLQWLMEVMPGTDMEAEKARETLMMWLGYLLVPDRSHHKALSLVGERRTGKGTMLRLIQRLVGHENVCQTSLTEISGRFGLEPLLGRTVAMIGDARPGKANADLSTGAERMLAITGGDCLGVDRKNRASLPSVDLPVRFVMASNGNFNMPDPNGVLATRLVTLQFDQSFAGRENSQIEAAFVEELPGILAWAVRGLQRLSELGGFHDLKSTKDACEISQEIAQPLLAFMDDAFANERGDDIDIDDVYSAYVGWWARHKPKANPISKTQLRNEIGSCRTGVKVVRRGTGNGRSRFLVGVTPNESFDRFKADGELIIERQLGERERFYPERRF